MKKTTLLFLFILLSPPVAMAVDDDKRPTLNADIGELIYYIGGGQVTPPPGAGFRSHTITARYRAGFSYSCGKFDFHNNLTQMINEIKTQVREIPGQLQMAAAAAIAGLPGYLAMKYNPTLYNTVMQTIDGAQELFKLSYKTCKQIEAEMKRDPTSNPYSNFMQASAFGKWSTEAKKPDANVADAAEEVREKPGAPVNWFGTNKAGTAANPIQINHDFVIAGYNLMIGRPADKITEKAAPIGTLAQHRVVKIWPSPLAAGEWIQKIVGDEKMVLDDESARQKIKSGDGLRPIVEGLDIEIKAALRKAYDDHDFSDINKYKSVEISGALITALHVLQPAQAGMMMSRLASELAVNEAQERTFLIEEMMRLAMLSPDMAASEAGAAAIEYVRGTSFKSLNKMRQEIFNDLLLKQRTVNKTTIAILNLAEKARNEAIAAQPATIYSEPEFIGGGIKKPPPTTTP